MKKKYPTLLIVIIALCFFSYAESNAQSESSRSNIDPKFNVIEGLKIHPSPVKSGESLYITSAENHSKIVCVYNNLGERILYKVMTDPKLDTSELNKGIHIIQITEGGHTATRKLVIN